MAILDSPEPSTTTITFFLVISSTPLMMVTCAESSQSQPHSQYYSLFRVVSSVTHDLGALLLQVLEILLLHESLLLSCFRMELPSRIPSSQLFGTMWIVWIHKLLYVNIRGKRWLGNPYVTWKKIINIKL